MDFYSASGIPILWCCFFQTIGIGWFFGATKFANCVEQMTGYKPHAYWWWTWAVIAPGTMFVSHDKIISCQSKRGKMKHYIVETTFARNDVTLLLIL